MRDREGTGIAALECQAETYCPRTAARERACGRPVAFDAGDGNFFRYASNDPTGLLDPSGCDFEFPCSEKTAKMTLSVQLKVEWVDGKNDKWTEKEKKDFQSDFKWQVEAIWNNNPFLLESKDGEWKFIPQIQISFVDSYTNHDHKYKLKIYKDPLEGGALAFTADKTINASASNALKPVKYEFISEEGGKPITIEGSIAAHEFGHLIGLSHPGAIVADPEDQLRVFSKDTSTVEGGAVKGENSPAAYEADVFALMGRGRDLRSWMFKSWTEYLNEEKKLDAPWKVVADKSHAKYKTSYENWEKYCKNRLTDMKLGIPFGDLLAFDENK
jgi:hypothetical protein